MIDTLLVASEPRIHIDAISVEFVTAFNAGDGASFFRQGFEYYFADFPFSFIQFSKCLIGMLG